MTVSTGMRTIMIKSLEIVRMHHRHRMQSSQSKTKRMSERERHTQTHTHTATQTHIFIFDPYELITSNNPGVHMIKTS